MSLTQIREFIHLPCQLIIFIQIHKSSSSIDFFDCLLSTFFSTPYEEGKNNYLLFPLSNVQRRLFSFLPFLHIYVQNNIVGSKCSSFVHILVVLGVIVCRRRPWLGRQFITFHQIFYLGSWYEVSEGQDKCQFDITWR